MALFRPAPRRYHSRLIALATVVAALAAAPKAHAADYTFDGYFGAANPGWSYRTAFGITNWTRNALPVSAYSTDIYFGASGTSDNLVSNMDYASFSVRTLNFRTTGSVTLSGNAIRIAGGGVVWAGGGTHSVSNALELNANASASASNDVVFSSTGLLTSTGVISGQGRLVKTFGGTLVLTGANTYTGGTRVGYGRLIDHNPHGDYDTAADLEFAIAGNSTYAGLISGSGTFTKSGAGTLTFSGANTYTGATNISGGTLLQTVDNALSSETALTVAGGATYDLTANNVSQAVSSLSGSGTVKVSRTLTVSGTSDSTFDGTITGAGSLTKSGAGTLTLSGLNTYAGGTTVNMGRLIDLNPHGSYVTNADLEFAKAGNYTYSSPITGTGSFTKSGAGILTLSGVNTYKGGTTVAAGRLIDLNPHGDYITKAALEFGKTGDYALSGTITGTGSLTKSGAGTLTLTGLNTYAGGTTVAAGRLIDHNPHGDYVTKADLEFANAGDYVFSGKITDAGTFTKSGAGTLTLSGANTYTGGTTISMGRLIDLQPHGNYLDNAELEFAPLSDSTYGGVVSGMGSFTKGGTKSLTLNGLNVYEGSTTVREGVLRNGVDGALPAATALIVDSSAVYSPNGKTQTVGSLAGVGTVDLGGGALTVGGAASTTFFGAISGAGSLVKDGAGTLTLRGSVAPSVFLQVAAGVLKGSTDIFKSDVTSTGGTLQFDQTKSGLYAGTYSGAGALLKTGSRSLTLTNAPGNSGGVRVSGGTLIVDAEGSFGGGLTVDAGTTFLNTSGGTLMVDGRTYNRGEVNTIDGSTTVFDGLVSGAGGFSGFGDVEFNGGYDPGNSPARVTFQSFASFGSGNRLEMELAGILGGSRTNSTTQYDQLDFTRGARLNGALDVVQIDGFVASLGNTFDLFDWNDPFTGTFSSINLPTLGNGLVWNTSALYTTGTISVQAVPEPATMGMLAVGALGLLRRRRK